jgi:hypothetical protein
VPVPAESTSCATPFNALLTLSDLSALCTSTPHF